MPVAGSPIRDVDRWLLPGVTVCLATLAVHRLFAYDIWWQIAAGRFIVGHGIPEIDPFSFGFAGQSWIEPRWLWCLLVFAIYSWFGVNFLILLKVCLLVVALGLLVAAGRGQPRWAVASGAIVVLAAAHERFMVRPELLSFVALMATLLCLQRFKNGGSSRWIWLLPVMQLVWCNAHTLWVLGPVTLWIVVLAEWIEQRLVGRRVLQPRVDTITGKRLRTLVIVAGAASSVTWVNPYLVRGVLFPFGLFREIRAGHMFSEAIAEFRSPFSDYFLAVDLRTAALVAVIVISLAGFVVNRRRTPLSRLALWGAYLFVAVEAQRNVALFAWVAGFATMLNLGQWYAAAPRRYVPWVARAAVALFVLLVIPAAVTDRLYRSQGSLKRFGFGVSDHRFPVRALAFIREQGLPTPVFHALGDGGYVMFEGGPGSVYTDGRLEVYGSDKLAQAFRVSWTGEGLDAESDRTGANTVIVRNDIGYRPLLLFLEDSDDWFPVYYDPLHLVYLRNRPETGALIERYGFDWSAPREHRVTPPSFPASAPWWVDRRGDAYADERLGSLLAGVGNYALALQHFERAHARRDPYDRRTRMFLGLFREAQGRQTEADALLASVPAHYLMEPEVHVLAGGIHLWADNPARAVEHYRRARTLGWLDPVASLRIARAALMAGDAASAEQALVPLITHYPDEVELWNLMAVLEVKRGRLHEAAAHFEHSLGLEPDQENVRKQLAAVNRQLGSDPGAEGQ
jgi:Flp pilus assembly protein TadD